MVGSLVGIRECSIIYLLRIKDAAGAPRWGDHPRCARHDRAPAERRHAIWHHWRRLFVPVRLDSHRWPDYTACCSLTDMAFGSFPRRRAQVAQLVEHAIENRSVAGSIPALGTIFPRNLFG
jgi:hypothetical protein